MKKKVAIIWGITGQDGSYLTELLLKKNYIVHGVKRRSSLINTSRIDHIYENPQLKKRNLYIHYGDLSDYGNIYRLIATIKPDEIYNLAAQSHVDVSFQKPEYTSDINALGTLRILDSIKNLGLTKKTKFYQASTSELYGLVQSKKQSEKTPFYPRSPYGVSKLFSYWITINYREAYDLYACNGILFNHESPRRGETFVTRKITRGLSDIYIGNKKCLYMGNLSAKRDWGHAKDYVYMQWLMLQQTKPQDFVIATGKQYTIRDFIKKCGNYLGLEIQFKGKGTREVGFISKINKNYNKNLKPGNIIIRIDKQYFRPSEVDTLLGDPSLAKKKLGWKPKYNINSLINEMMASDLKESKKEHYIKNNL
jgi:GDPmannose 4,6-dehydratase